MSTSGRIRVPTKLTPEKINDRREDREEEGTILMTPNESPVKSLPARYSSLLSFPSCRYTLWCRDPMGTREVVDPPTRTLQVPFAVTRDLYERALSGSSKRYALDFTCLERRYTIERVVEQRDHSFSRVPVRLDGERSSASGIDLTRSEMRNAIETSTRRRDCNVLRCTASADSKMRMIALRFDVFLPTTRFSVVPLTPLPLFDSPLSRVLQTGPGVGIGRSGYLTMTRSRRLVPLLPSDPNSRTMPLVGIWIVSASSMGAPGRESNTTFENDRARLWNACHRYVHADGVRERVSAGKNGDFLVGVFDESNTAKGSYNFELLECAVVASSTDIAVGHFEWFDDVSVDDEGRVEGSAFECALTRIRGDRVASFLDVACETDAVSDAKETASKTQEEIVVSEKATSSSTAEGGEDDSTSEEMGAIASETNDVVHTPSNDEQQSKADGEDRVMSAPSIATEVVVDESSVDRPVSRLERVRRSLESIRDRLCSDAFEDKKIERDQTRSTKDATVPMIERRMIDSETEAKNDKAVLTEGDVLASSFDKYQDRVSDAEIAYAAMLLADSLDITPISQQDVDESVDGGEKNASVEDDSDDQVVRLPIKAGATNTTIADVRSDTHVEDVNDEALPSLDLLRRLGRHIKTSEEENSEATSEEKTVEVCTPQMRPTTVAKDESYCPENDSVPVFDSSEAERDVHDNDRDDKPKDTNDEDDDDVENDEFLSLDFMNEEEIAVCDPSHMFPKEEDVVSSTFSADDENIPTITFVSDSGEEGNEDDEEEDGVDDEFMRGLRLKYSVVKEVS